MLNIILNPGLVWLGNLALRVVIGVIFIIHGKQKMARWKTSPNEQAPAPMLNLMRTLSIAEPLGGLTLILSFLIKAPIFNLLGQLAIIGLSLVMLGAIWLKSTKWKTPFTTLSATGWEFDLMILAGLVALFFSF